MSPCLSPSSIILTVLKSTASGFAECSFRFVWYFLMTRSKLSIICRHIARGLSWKEWLGSVAKLVAPWCGWPEGNSYSRHWVCHVWCLLGFLWFLDSVILTPQNSFRTCTELFHQLICFPTSAVLTWNFRAALWAPQAGEWPRGHGKLGHLVTDHSVAVQSTRQWQGGWGGCRETACKAVPLARFPSSCLCPELDCIHSRSQWTIQGWQSSFFTFLSPSIPTVAIGLPHTHFCPAYSCSKAWEAKRAWCFG